MRAGAAASGVAIVAAFFATMPLSILCGNYLVWLIKPARRRLDAEAAGFPGTSFREAQASMLRFACVLVPLALAVALGAALQPWSQGRVL